MSKPSSAKKTPVVPVKLTDIREEDEYIAEANKIKDVYLEKPVKPKPGNVGPALSLRERILSMSLFPNIFRPEQHHRTFKNVKTDDEDGENYFEKRTPKERREGLE